MKDDLRYERTENAIRQAFLSLLKDKELNNLSVSELCQQAQVSRNAFYQHYESKEHLYESILQELMLSLEQACTPLAHDLNNITNAEKRLFLDNILQAIEQNRDVISQFLQSQPATFSYAFQNMLSTIMQEEKRKINHNISDPFIPIFTAGVVAFVNYWLTQSSYNLKEAQDKCFKILGNMATN